MEFTSFFPLPPLGGEGRVRGDGRRRRSHPHQAGPATDNFLIPEADLMAVFTCEKCGSKVETRCKPKKCSSCGETGAMCKVEAAAPPKKGKK